MRISREQMLAVVARLWTVTQVAAYLGVQVGTASTYRSRRQMPEPLGRIGNSWVWDSEEIKEWTPKRSRRARKR